MSLPGMPSASDSAELPERSAQTAGNLTKSYIQDKWCPRGDPNRWPWSARIDGVLELLQGRGQVATAAEPAG